MQKDTEIQSQNLTCGAVVIFIIAKQNNYKKPKK